MPSQGNPPTPCHCAQPDLIRRVPAHLIRPRVLAVAIARVNLLCAAYAWQHGGKPLESFLQETRLSRTAHWRWARKFAAHGFLGLIPASPPGRPRQKPQALKRLPSRRNPRLLARELRRDLFRLAGKAERIEKLSALSGAGMR